MMETEKFTIVRMEFTVPMARALECRDIPMCELGCRTCEHYGKAWICPPFEKYDFAGLHPETFDTLRLFIFRFEPQTIMTIEEARNEYNAAIKELMKDVRREASAIDAVVYGNGYDCDLCQGSCRRHEGTVCQHPAQASPSLEAVGFNVVKLLKSCCDIDLLWSDTGDAPRATHYVVAYAY